MKRSYIRNVGTNDIFNESEEFMAGQIVFIAQDTPPAGWLRCNGAAVSRATYGTLFAAIGTHFGPGDGATTFNLPDLRGEFIRGLDEGRGADAGRARGSWQASDFKSHTHTTPSGASPLSLGGMSAGAAPISQNYQSVTGAAGGTETRPRNVALIPVIKY